jgi:hypothetical protein
MAWKSLALISVLMLAASAAAHNGSSGSREHRFTRAAAFHLTLCTKSSPHARIPNWVKRLKTAQCEWHQRSEGRRRTVTADSGGLQTGATP